MHNLWDRAWITDDGYEHAALGMWTGARTWSRGDLPVRLPLPKLVGEASCIRDGEDPNLAGRDANCGDQGCLLPPQCYALEDAFEAKTNIWDCAFAYHCARIVETQYTDIDAAEAMAKVLFGDDAIITKFDPFAGTIPNMMVVQFDRNYFVFITGTTTPQELALQICTGVEFPVNQGMYSTTTLYEVAALRTLDRLGTTTIPDALRCTLIGHSYGGAIAYVTAAKLKSLDLLPRIEMLTFGMPKSGDARLVALNRSLKQIHYCAFDDPVPWVPTDGALSFSVLDIMTPLYRQLGAAYARPAKIFVITEEKEIVPKSTSPVDNDLYRTIVELLSSAIDPPAFDGHFMRNYSRRILEACPNIDDDCDLFPIDHTDPERHGHWSYKLTIVGLVITNGTFTLDLSREAIFAAFDDTVWYAPLPPFQLARLQYYGTYPDGPGLAINAGGYYTPVDATNVGFELPLAPQQADIDDLGPPIPPFGWSIVTPGTARLTYLRVADDWPVNSNDDFPL